MEDVRAAKNNKIKNKAPNINPPGICPKAMGSALKTRSGPSLGIKTMSKNLISRLNEGPILCAEGYLFAMERRGYLQAGAFVPEVVLEHPEVVSQLHREFIRAGSDIVQAFTYYGHREKLRIIGKEHLLESLQKNALKIAKDARNEFKDLDLLVCGDVANTNIYDPKDKKTNIDCQKMFEEQVMWAKEAGVDFVVAETITWLEEAKIALKVIKDAGLIAVSNLSIKKGDP